jgi:predicted nucleic acid-binding protein
MTLVDTSTLISFFRDQKTPSAIYFEEMINQKVPIALTPIVVQEVLQGVRDLREWRRLQKYLLTQEMLFPKHRIDTYLKAGRIYFDCRKRGLTVRSHVDCLIAQIAIENSASILHEDSDYEAIAKVRSLRTLPRPS